MILITSSISLILSIEMSPFGIIVPKRGSFMSDRLNCHLTYIIYEIEPINACPEVNPSKQIIFPFEFTPQLVGPVVL